MKDFTPSKCEDMRELLSAFRDAELDAADKRRVEEHLGTCADCREELSAVESVVKSLQSLPSVSLEKDFSMDIESIIQKSSSQQTDDKKVVPIGKRRNATVWLAVAAAISVFAIVATYFATGSGVAPNVVADKNIGSSVVVPEKKEQSAPAVAHINNRDKALLANQPQGNEVPAIKQEEPIKVAVQPKKTIPVAVKPAAKSTRRVIHVDDLEDHEALLAFAESNDDADISDEIGISTNEDGLYAIKM